MTLSFRALRASVVNVRGGGLAHAWLRGGGGRAFAGAAPVELAAAFPLPSSTPGWVALGAAVAGALWLGRTAMRAHQLSTAREELINAHEAHTALGRHGYCMGARHSVRNHPNALPLLTYASLGAIFAALEIVDRDAEFGTKNESHLEIAHSVTRTMVHRLARADKHAEAGHFQLLGAAICIGWLGQSPETVHGLDDDVNVIAAHHTQLAEWLRAMDHTGQFVTECDSSLFPAPIVTKLLGALQRASAVDGEAVFLVPRAAVSG